MRPDDSAALIELWVAAWRATMPAIDFDARRPWIAAFLSDPAHRTLVIETAAGAPAGFVSLEGDILHQLAVAPDARGRGTAGALLAAAKAGAARLTLDVNQANARAIRFYEREGFRRTCAGTNPSSGLATWTMVWL